MRFSARGAWRLVLSALCLLRASTGLAQLCAAPERCLELIEAQQRQTRSLAARFTQTKHLSLMNDPLINHGRFAFRMPDTVLWEMEDPSFIIRIDHNGLSLPNRPDLQGEVQAMAPLTTMLREMSSVFTGATTVLRERFVVTTESTDTEITLHLQPRQAEWARMFSAVDLTFRAPDFVIARLQMQESIGDRLVIDFTEMHRNDNTAELWLAGATPKP